MFKNRSYFPHYMFNITVYDNVQKVRNIQLSEDDYFFHNGLPDLFRWPLLLLWACKAGQKYSVY